MNTLDDFKRWYNRPCFIYRDNGGYRRLIEIDRLLVALKECYEKNGNDYYEIRVRNFYNAEPNILSYRFHIGGDIHKGSVSEYGFIEDVIDLSLPVDFDIDKARFEILCCILRHNVVYRFMDFYGRDIDMCINDIPEELLITEEIVDNSIDEMSLEYNCRCMSPWVKYVRTTMGQKLLK